jgi:SAM-dependent methyltransferase
MNEQEIARLQTVVDGYLNGRNEVSVLEAGCGSATRLNLHGKAKVVGLDVSEQQLARNTQLDERILGDVETYPLPANRFDMVVCWNVLEHVPHPDLAVANLAAALGDDGLLILAVPNAASLKGIVTKFTPYGFHLWVHRVLLGRREAGTEGRGPFPTFMRRSMSPPALVRAASARELKVEYLRLYEGDQQRRIRRRLWLVGPVWWLLRTAVGALSLNTISADLTDCFLVFRKRARQMALRPD